MGRDNYECNSKFMKMKNEMENIERMLGKVKFGIRRNEKNAKQFKRKKII